MTGYVTYGLVLPLLAFSFFKDRQKTGQAIKKALKHFLGLLPILTVIMVFAGMTLAVLDPGTITALIGESSGIVGVGLCLAVGAVTFMPPFVAFPLGATLLGQGAGYPQIAAFLTTLMGIGAVTLPLETKYFGKNATIWRNILCLAAAVAAVSVIAVVM